MITKSANIKFLSCIKKITEIIQITASKTVSLKSFLLLCIGSANIDDIFQDFLSRNKVNIGDNKKT